MNIDLIAITKTVGTAIESRMHTSPDNAATDTLAEFAGRTCYLSYDKPNIKTRSNENYLANIIGQQHESVLEHSSASFLVEGVSRNLLIELERHRFLSFSVVSTRYVNVAKLNLVEPMANGGGTREFWAHEVEAYYDEYWKQTENGKSRKQAREAAAYHLPGGIETRFVVSGNFRAWRDVIRKRMSPAANAEIHEFARQVLGKLKTASPNSFQDLEIS